VVSATQLAQLTFVAGAVGASDDLLVWASDGQLNSLVSEFPRQRSNVNHAGRILTVASANVAATAGPVAARPQALFQCDPTPDNDALAYFIYDNSSAADSGHFCIQWNGGARPQTSYAVTATQLAQLTFVAGAAGASDEFDGVGLRRPASIRW